MSRRNAKRTAGSYRQRAITKTANLNLGTLNPAAQNGSGKIAGNRGLSRQLYSQLKRMCGDATRSPRPPFSYNTRPLDRWMLRALDEERTGFLNSFIDQASMIHAGRAYQLTGPAPLVEQSLRVLHNADGGDGFRALLKKVAINYYCSNFGGAIYLHRNTPARVEYNPMTDDWLWDLPPVSGLYSTDSTAFYPNYDYVYPYVYDGTPWMRPDMIRVVSMPSTQIETWDVGRCALYRCIHVASLTSALYEHVFDLVMPDSTKGIITIHGLTAEEFLEAILGSESRNEVDAVNKPTQTHHDDGRLLTNTDIGDILVLADRDTEIDVKYVTLGRIPEGFFIDSWVKTVLQAFASNIGFALSEFIDSSNSRLIGQSGAEVEANVTRGATKGGNEFIIQLQEKMQMQVIPRTVHFEFSARDAGQELVDVQILREKAEMLVELYEAVQPAIINQADESVDTVIESKSRGQFMITRDEARRYGIEMGVLPSWLASTDTGTDVTVTDEYADLSHLRVKRLREEARERKAIRDLAANPLGEQVIMYENSRDPATGYTIESTTVLWESDTEIGRPAAWAGFSTPQPKKLEDGRSKPTFNWRASEEKRTVEEALEDSNMVALRGLFRRGLMAQTTSDAPFNTALGDQGMAEMQARLYEIARAGALEAAGKGKRTLTQNQSANIAAILTDTVKRRIKFLTTGGASTNGDSPTDPRLEKSIDEETRSIIGNAIGRYTDQDELAMMLEEMMLRRATLLGNTEGLRARMLGIVIAGRILGAKGKKWIPSVAGEPRLDHVKNWNQEVGFEEPFKNGDYWPQTIPNCVCDLELVW